ncbi:hypothetical protein QF032_004320 [Streptomyces achromogenes]|nr:hypothetical protein [Streptomyces achromogenes]
MAPSPRTKPGSTCAARSAPVRSLPQDSGVLEVEVHHLTGVALPVPLVVRRVDGRPQKVQSVTVGVLQEPEPGRPALLHRAHPVRVPDRHEQVVADFRSEEVDVVPALHLVADDLQLDAEVAGVLLVLAIDGDPLARRFGDEERDVEAGEHAGGEGVRAGGHVDHDVLVTTVHQVVQAQLHRPRLGVVAGDPQVGFRERSRDHQTDGATVEFHRPGARVVHRVVLAHPQQTRAPAGRSRLDHRLGGGDAGVGTAQIVLDQRQPVAHRGQSGGVRLVEAERGAEVLVDVRVDRDDGCAGFGEVTDEQGGQGRLAAAALPDESNFHVHQA